MALYDLAIRGGTVIDPAAGINARLDVGIVAGTVAALEAAIPTEAATVTVDASGKLVLPGLIDLHAHVFWGVGGGAHADRHCLPQGTTTLVDGGSVGAQAFEGFKEYVLQRSRTRCLAWLNLSTIGLIDTRVGELMNLLYLDVEAAVRTIEAHRALIVGLKARLSTNVAGGSCRPALTLLRQAADAVGLPVMVHIGDTAEPLSTILTYLRPGDVVTHALTGRRHGILDHDGNLWPAVCEARAAGIHFDAAAGRDFVSFPLTRRALEQGFLPDTLSTDITLATGPDPAFHLPTLVSKVMALGVPLVEAFALVTSAPARFLSRAGTWGTLQPGAVGDVAVLELVEEDVTLRDSDGRAVQAPRWLRPWRTVRDGTLVGNPL